MGQETPSLHPQDLESLIAYNFPDNMRELKNIIERTLIESRDEIRPHDLHFSNETPPETAASALADLAPDLPLEEIVAQSEVWAVQRAIARANGNVSEAARLLGTNRNKVYRVLGKR